MALANSAPPGKRTIALGIVAFALLAFVAIWFAAPSAAPPGLDLSRSKASDKGRYMVAIEPEAGSFRQGELHAWLVTPTMPTGTPVEGAKITVDGGMPEHNHGLPTSPAVTAYLGAGKYRADGVKFHMSGWWQLKFAISAASGDDTAVFNLKL